MLLSYNGITPTIEEDVFVAPTAVLIGSVHLARGSSVWFGAVLRGDEGEIRVGRGANVQDNAVIHSVENVPTIVGEDVTIGHGVMMEGCVVHSNAVIGMGSVILPGAEIGEGALVGAGSVVMERQVIPAHTLAAGAPAQVKKELSEKSRQVVEMSAPIYHHLRERYLAQGLDSSEREDQT